MSRGTFPGFGKNMRTATSPVSVTQPLTMACWFQASSFDGFRFFICIGEEDDANSFVGLGTHAGVGDNDERLRVTVADSGGSTIDGTSNLFGTGTWHHACLVNASVTSHRAILDGDFANEASFTTSRTPGTPDSLTIGNNNTATASANLHWIAEVAVWDVELTDAEITILNSGVSALLVRPGSLKYYAPMWGVAGSNEVDRISGLVAVDSGGDVPAQVNPPIIYRPSAQIIEIGAGGPPPSDKRGIILGNTTINAMNLGNTAINKAYIGSTEIFN